VGFWLERGRRTVRLHYRPDSFFYGLAAFALGSLLVAARPFRPLRSSG
jgi:hypothetical protein